MGAALRGRLRSRSYAHAGLVVDYDRRRVTVGGRAVRLTPIEYKALRLASSAAPRPVASTTLLRRAWGPEATDTERVGAFVRNLRLRVKPARCAPIGSVLVVRQTSATTSSNPDTVSTPARSVLPTPSRSSQPKRSQE